MEAYSPVVDTSTRLALLMPVKEGTALVDLESEMAFHAVPPWVSSVTNGAVIFPVFTFRIYEVRHYALSHMYILTTLCPIGSCLKRKHHAQNLATAIARQGHPTECHSSLEGVRWVFARSRQNCIGHSQIEYFKWGEDRNRDCVQLRAM